LQTFWVSIEKDKSGLVWVSIQKDKSGPDFSNGAHDGPFFYATLFLPLIYLQ